VSQSITITGSGRRKHRNYTGRNQAESRKPNGPGKNRKVHRVEGSTGPVFALEGGEGMPTGDDHKDDKGKKLARRDLHMVLMRGRETRPKRVLRKIVRLVLLR